MDDLVISGALVIPGAEIRLSFSRSGGPGGQNVNKVETKVEVRWRPEHSTAIPPELRDRLLKRLAKRLTADGDLLVTSNRTRDQVRNRKDALEKLAGIVRAALVRRKRRRPTRPTGASVEARLQRKHRTGSVKEDRRTIKPARED